MNEKDPKIEYLLRKQADADMPPADAILGKARAEMRAARPERKKVTGRFFAVAAVAAAVLLFIVLTIGIVQWLPSADKEGGMADAATDNMPGVSDPAEDFGYYRADALLGRTVSYQEAETLFASVAQNQAFPVPRADADTMRIASQKLYAYRLQQTQTDVLLECRMRVVGEQGNDEITLYFELTDDTYEKNSGYLRLPQGQNGIRMQEEYQAGEYVSRAYLQDNYRCMICVMNGNGYRLSYYLDVLFGEVSA